jgi:bile acid:Na+ symporter, BASS family
VAEKIIAAITFLVPIALPLVTLSIGMQTGGPQLRKLFASPGLVVRYFLATFVVMPALPIVLGMLERLSTPMWVGLALMSIAPPAPPATGRLRKFGDSEIGLAWQTVAFLISIITVPVTVYLIASQFSRNMNLDFGPLLQRSILFFGAPLIAGLLVRRLWPRLADAIGKPVSDLANIAMLLVVVLVLIVAIPVIWHFGLVPDATVAGFVAVAVVVAHLLGGPARDTRITLAAMLAARFPLPALMLARQNNSVKLILPVVAAYIIAGVILVPLYARITAPRK